MALRVYSFRLDDGLVGRIDGLGVKRSDFVRDALEAALGCEKNSIVAAGDGSGEIDFGGDGFSDDELSVLGVVRSGWWSRHEVEKQVGLFGISFFEIEPRLLERRAISIVNGVVIAHG